MYHGKPSVMELQSALHEDDHDAFIIPHVFSPRAADHDVVTATSPMLVTSRHNTAMPGIFEIDLSIASLSRRTQYIALYAAPVICIV